MLEPEELYELNGDLPDLARPVLVHAITGFVDAGNAIHLAREHLLASDHTRVIAKFDIDRMLDYRSRRPMMLFVEDHWESYEDPQLALHLVHDDSGTPFLLLAGSEPDLYWERFIMGVRQLIDRLGVRLTVGLSSIPMAVPHTRPIGVTAHATRPDLIAGYEPWVRRVQVPGSASNLLEYRLGKHGHDALGFAVHVPHYLAQIGYPAASEQLLTNVSRATGLHLSTDDLRAAADGMRSDIDAQVAQTEEARALVLALEQQYDATTRDRQGGSNPLPAEGDLPTADELGAELERFLADHTKRGDQPNP